MAQEDKIKREIDRIGLVLAKLLGMLLHKPNQHEEAVKEVIQQMQDELDIDLGRLPETDKEELLQYLVKQKNFSNDHLRLFANLLYETAGTGNDNNQQALLKSRALHIYEYIQANANGTLYLDVVYRIRELNESSPS